MASRTSRKLVVRGRPPGYTGISGSTKAHCPSVTSLGYLCCRIPTTYEKHPLWDSHSIFTGNIAHVGGGAIDSLGGMLSVNNSTISGNQTSNVPGGGGVPRCAG